MKDRNRTVNMRAGIVGGSLAAGAIVWLLDAAVGAFMSQGDSFPDLVLLSIPPDRLVFRIVAAGMFLVLGLAVHWRLTGEGRTGTKPVEGSHFDARPAVGGSSLPPSGTPGAGIDTSEREEAAAALRESEGRFRSIVESAPIGVFLYGLEPDGRLVLEAVNPAASGILGVDMTGLVGKTIEEAFPPLAETEVPERYRRAAELGIEWHSEEIRYDHGEISGAFEVSAFQTAPNEVAVMFLDATERKKAEEAVRASEARLRVATRSGRVGIWEYEIATDRLEWDDLMFELHGVDPEGAGDGIQRWRDCVHPDDLDTAEAEFMASFQEGGPPFDSQFRIIRPMDGQVRHIRGMCGISRDEEGNAVRALGTNWDVTESTRAREVLLDSERRFRKVIEEMNDAAYILYDGGFDLVNPRFCELTGISPEDVEVPGFTFWDLVAPSSVPMIKERQAQRERGEEVPGIYEFEVQRPDGGVVQVEASVREIEYRDGSAVLGVLRDVTEQRSLKEQLLMAQKMESVGRLSGGVAHDLNNLLTPILGYGELVLSDIPPEGGMREPVQEIMQAALRARDLVRQLLAFGRRQAMEFQVIDLNEMIEGFQSLLRRAVQEDIEIHLNPAPFPLAIRGDRGQLEQVIMNFAVNAQDAMPDGGLLTIETDEVVLDEEYARLHAGVKPGRYAMFSFSDTGVGMDPHTVEQIFEPFFTTKERGKGTGLGLATVYGIIKQHDGNVVAYSEPGMGATFKCYFPLTQEQAKEEVRSRERPLDTSGTETIMVVEDEDTVRDLAVRVLTRQGYTVLHAGHGKACLELLAEHDGPLDLLLTDVVMPGLNGRELFEEVGDRFPGTKVLYMSGYTEDIVTHKGVLFDGTPFIQKPFAVVDLVSRVRSVLETA